MENQEIGLRTQDFHEGLRETTHFGPKDVKFKKTLLIGKAASLAMHLRGLLYVDNVEQLEWAASTLGIGSHELPMVLQELEVIDFIRMNKTGDSISRIDVKVPEFRSGYAELGQRWKDIKPNAIEEAGVGTLDLLHFSPSPVHSIQSSLGLESADFAMLRDVMQLGKLLAVETVDGVPTAFSPLAVDGNPLAYLKWAKQFPSEIRSLIELLQGNQGIVVNDTRLTANSALGDAIHTGVLLPVTVNGATGVQQFLFAPRGGLRPVDRTILDKARALLSCVRYGQGFASGRKIRFPRAILQTLRSEKQFSRGHPDLFTQYGLLVEKMIGHPVHEGGGRWNFRIDDTEENMKALDIAIEMLEHGESPSANIDIDAQKALLSPSSYLGPATTRVRMTELPVVSTETRTAMIREFAKLARGMETHG